MNLEKQLPQDVLVADVGRPLLQLVQHLTGMETAFITAIDWEGQYQDVLLSLNTGSISVQEGGRVEWKHSLCRSMFLAGRLHSADVVDEIPEAEHARQMGMRSFLAVPILVGEVAIGTVCGASSRPIQLDEHQLASMQFIAASLHQQLEARAHLLSALDRVQASAEEVERVRREAEEHREAAQRLEVLANTDALTGLLNRRAFTARWEDQLARSARRGYAVGVLLIDLDRFKDVNDSSGHAAGDAALVAVAATLGAVANTPDITARLGGDEFAMVVTHATGQGLVDLAERLCAEFAQRMRAAGTPGITMSIGAAVSTSSARGELLAAADRALYSSKGRGGDCVHLAGSEAGE